MSAVPGAAAMMMPVRPDGRQFPSKSPSHHQMHTMSGKEAGQRRAGRARTHDQEVGFDDVGVGHVDKGLRCLDQGSQQTVVLNSVGARGGIET